LVANAALIDATAVMAVSPSSLVCLQLSARHQPTQRGYPVFAGWHSQVRRKKIILIMFARADDEDALKESQSEPARDQDVSVAAAEGPVATVDGRPANPAGAVDLIRRASSVRVALLLGFTVVFALWLAWGYQLLQNFRHIEDNVESLQRDYLRGELALSKVRMNVLLGSIYLRDALIDNTPARREYYRHELNRLRDEIEAVLAAYTQDLPRAERDRWVPLQEELRDYWSSRDVAFTDDARTTSESYLLLRERVVPRRDGVLQIVDQLGNLQAAAREQQETETAALFSAVRARLILIGALTLVGAFAAAVLSTRRVGRLQHQVEQQRFEEQRIRRDMERLSAGLVDIQVRERREISRELHDAIGQSLTALKLDIGIALRGDLSERTRAALHEAKDITENTLQNVRDLSQLLHPSMLDDFGLPDTLHTYLKRFSERTGIRSQLLAALPDRLPNDIEASLYRIIQEAMNNVARHSGASACTVTINARRSDLLLMVEDNGCGMKTTSRGHGLGLIAMRERACAQGGSMTIEAPASGGTRVVVTMQVRSSGPAAAVEDLTSVEQVG
jgi:signal transduction histidine kinase